VVARKTIKHDQNEKIKKKKRIDKHLTDLNYTEQEGLAVASIARDDPSTLPRDDPSTTMRGKLGSEFEI